MNIGVFKTDQPIMIEPYPNGGWVVTQRDENPSIQPVRLGAYSTAEDMLSALSDALDPPSQTQ
jgi:hypothetical protein